MEFNVPRMVGRDRELCQLKDLLHNAVEGKGNVALISGEAGIGKTRLIKELEAYAEPLGIRVLEGRCLYESPTPFLPFREALRNVFEVSKSDAPPSQKRKLRKAIKQSAPDFMILAGTTVAYRTYKDEKDKEKIATLGTLMERDTGLESICDLLVAISKKQPLLLFIDDLHLADTPSLSLFYYLARRVHDSKILVVGAYRPQEVSGALLDIMQMMSRDGLSQKEELERLKEADHSDFAG
jgi:predicted ATPase